MPWGRSDGPKQAEAAQKEREAAVKHAEWQAEQQRLRAEWKLQSYPDSTVGRAEAAMQSGARFFQLAIAVSELTGPESSFGSSANQLQSRDGVPDLLGQIEELGWRLEHVGYVFVETGATSTNRALSSGQGTVTEGQVQGIYLFRNTTNPAEP